MGSLNFKQTRALNAILALGSDHNLSMSKKNKFRILNPGENLLWTMFVDGICWKSEKGFGGYAHREYGYKDIQLTSQAILSALQNIDQELSLNVIQNIYHIFVQEDQKLLKANPFIFFASGTFGIVKQKNGEENRKTVTLDGLQQLQSRIENGYYTYYNLKPSLLHQRVQIAPNDAAIQEKIRGQEDIAIQCSFPILDKNNTLSNKFKIMEKAIENYNKEIKQSQSSDDKLKVIVEYVQLFEHIHPQHNYNCRTFCIALLNRLLIQNGFMPVIQLDPNNFDMNSVEELVCDVKKGMERMEVLLDKNKQGNTKIKISYDSQKFNQAFNDFRGLTAKAFEEIVNNIDHQTAEKMVNEDTQNLMRQLGEKIVAEFKSNAELYETLQTKIKDAMEKEGFVHIFPLESNQFLIPKIVDELCKSQLEKNIGSSLPQQIDAPKNTQFTQKIRQEIAVPPQEIPHPKGLVVKRKSLHSTMQLTKNADARLEKLSETMKHIDTVQPIFQSSRFLHYVAQGKQDEAQSLLSEIPSNTQALLRMPSLFTDYSGRTFNCTAYEYAYWAKDSHMCRMLERYMDEDTKTQLLARIDEMECIDAVTGEKIGLVYQQYGTIHRSAHFDFKPLKEALHHYVEGYLGWVDGSEAMKTAWIKIGKAQRDVPAHVAQEYCRYDRSFEPLPSFKEDELPRTLTFLNSSTRFNDSWFPLESTDLGLGFDFAIVRAFANAAKSGTCRPLLDGVKRSLPVELAAIIHLDEVRTRELTQLRDLLKPTPHPVSLRI
ncbi:hypothetical protein [Legionella sainthelensi]|uniref:hypothetical protein n=1 Tax=Legionella sainthelensi TaxID=28087 RepID=UPI000E1FE80C|nr:hypothetical protein [Legionella sainthelensi]